MQLLTICLIFLLFSCFPVCLQAQQTRYASFPEKCFIRIAGQVGNKIHVWTSPFQPVNNKSSSTEISLFIFSTSLNLLEKKKIVLAISHVRNISFLLEDSCYYANIFYNTEIEKRITLRISKDGDVNTIKDSLFVKSTFIPVQTKYPKSLIRQGNNFYFINSEAITDEINNKVDSEQLVVNKSDLTGNNIIARRHFNPENIHFEKGFLTSDGENIIASAFAKMQRNKAKPDEYLFAAWVDSNLNTLNKPALLKITLNKKDVFVPQRVYAVGKNLLILSNGFIGRTAFFYNGENNGINAPPFANQYSESNSLRLLLLNAQQGVHVDTVFESRANHRTIDFDNIFIDARPNNVDMFCLCKYTRTKNGIVHFNIDAGGNIVVDDMIVAPEYVYNLSDCSNPAPGLLLVPYSYKTKIGLARLLYGSGNR